MKKLGIILICVFALISCNPGKHVTQHYYGEDFNKQYAREMIVTLQQLDSICIADTLSSHFRDWYSAAFVDYETNKAKIKQYYTKTSINKRVFYILSPYDENRFKLVIRTEEKEEIEN